MCIRDSSKTDADGYDAKEFDLTLGYSAGGFNVSITDYWYNTGAGYFHYCLLYTSRCV